MSKRSMSGRLTAAGLMALVLVLSAYAGSSRAGVHATKLSTAIPGANKGNAPGTAGKTIKIAALYQMKSCGSVAADPATVAGTKERFATLAKWFNQHITFPGGRKLSVVDIDDGGTDASCGDVQRAAVEQAIQQDHVFAILTDSDNPALNTADIAAKLHTVIIGGNFETFHDLKTHYPYAWQTYEPGEQSFQELAWYIQKRFEKKPYVADNGTKSPRVWGQLFLDNTLGHVLANISKKQLAGVGVSVKQYFISQDNATAAQQASGLALQMQKAGVNSIVDGAVDGIPPAISFNTAASNARYYPDFFISEFGKLPNYAVFISVFGKDFARRLYATGPPDINSERVEVNAAGDISPASCPSCYGQDNNFNVASTKAYMQAGGSAGDHPQLLSYGWGAYIWPTIATLVIGTANAGPVLNAQTFAYGLEHGAKTSCMTQQFFGKQPYAQESKFGYDNPPRNYLKSGFTTLYFNPNRTTAYGSKGLFESYDNYQLMTGENSLKPDPRYDTGVAGNYKLVKQTGSYSIDTHC